MTDETNYEAEDSERVSRLSTAESEAATAPPPEMPLREPAGDEVVREYEERYAREPRKMRDMPRSYSTLHVSDDERLWAAIAHGSVWVTFIMFFTTAGFGVPLSIFIPLIVYLMFRKKSDYVAFHALQAFVLQLLGTVGALTLLVVGGITWLIGLVVALLLIVVIVGFVIAPLWALLGVVLLGIVVIMPFLMLLLGTIATIQTYNRHDYRYPYISRWVDRQLAGGLLNVI